MGNSQGKIVNYFKTNKHHMSRDVVSMYEAYFKAMLLCKKESLNTGTNCQ